MVDKFSLLVSDKSKVYPEAKLQNHKMWMPFVVSMLLGRTFDVNSFLSGQDIFDASSVSRGLKVIPRTITNTKCKILEEQVSTRDLLETGASISVAFDVKAIGVSLNPSFYYMKDTRDRENTVEYLCRVTYETVTETIPEAVLPKKGWLTKWSKQDLGTHYVRSVTYGGEMIASFLFKAKTDHDINKIAGALKAGVSYAGFGAEVGAKFERYTNELKEKATLDVKYYATTPLGTVPTQLEDFKGVIDNFKHQVKKVNNGRGVPIRVELQPLQVLSTSPYVPIFSPNTATKAILDKFEEKLRELRQADTELQSWALTLPPISPQQEQKLGEFSGQINQVMRKLMEAGQNLDFSKPPGELLLALRFYDRSLGNNIPFKFLRKLRSLKKEIEGNIQVGVVG